MLLFHHMSFSFMQKYLRRKRVFFNVGIITQIASIKDTYVSKLEVEKIK